MPVLFGLPVLANLLARRLVEAALQVRPELEAEMVRD
jgi:hypothetical protein